ncbi:MAG: hypothetical protein KJ583_04930 [Nanoarchaeota archaeon]|nr:hypothetical protein [Nanoarchaeota archaeon]MBU1269736.1 hypothetical protein [Nanoarchaeota archaeon]MBU1604634.1 hypothetical protein [Nanoarchaeota archaeon]MBU2443299.1 hypothetical protein [Nanoarchaeota archaeon]
MLKTIEKNTIYSFDLAKKDIRKLQEETDELRRTQQRIIDMLDDLKTSDVQLYKKINELNIKMSKPVDKTTVIVREGEIATGFVASKTGKSFHKTNCPFAQNINPKNKLTYKSKMKALNKGFKACKCINKK